MLKAFERKIFHDSFEYKLFVFEPDFLPVNGQDKNNMHMHIVFSFF